MTRALIRFLPIAVLMSVMFGTITSASAQNALVVDGLTGEYLHDARPEELMYLSLTHSGGGIQGYAVLIEPNTDSNVTDVLASQSLTVEGTVDGSSVTLVIGDWVNGEITMTGSKQGDDLVLTFPSTSGEIGSALFQPTTEVQFNQMVAEWRSVLATEAELWSMLPGDDLMPPGLEYQGGGTVGQETILTRYIDVTSRQLDEWGWIAAVDGMYSDPQGALPLDRTSMITVSLFRFGSPETASDALVAFLDNPIHEGSREYEAPAMGDQSRIVVNTLPDEDISGPSTRSTVYIQTYTTVVVIEGISTQGDPTAEVMELAKRMLDPEYAAVQAEKTQDMVDFSAQLDEQISTMYDTASWFDEQVEDTGSNLDDVEEAVVDMETELKNVQTEAAVRPMDCWQAGTVEFAFGTLEFVDGTLDFYREAFDSTASNLKQELSIKDQTIASVQSTASALTTVLQASPYPPPPLYAWPGDEQAAITMYTTAADQAVLDLDPLQSDYNAALTRADEIMAEGKAIVEDVQALAACEEPSASTEDPGAPAPEQAESETAAPLPVTAEGQEAADAARAISGLEATGDFSALYDHMHPDAQTIVPREVIVGWFGDYYAGKETTEITVTGVQFVAWTWPVTGVTYRHTAEVTFVQPIWENGEYSEIEDVVHLVQDDTGGWRWFFGGSREFVDEQIDKYSSSHRRPLAVLSHITVSSTKSRGAWIQH